jgi:hypothetical protein
MEDSTGTGDDIMTLDDLIKKLTKLRTDNHLPGSAEVSIFIYTGKGVSAYTNDITVEGDGSIRGIVSEDNEESAFGV